MKLLLVLSLAGNLAVLGVVVGHSLREQEGQHHRSDRVIDWIVDMMPAARRDLAIASFDEARGKIDAARERRGERLPAVEAAMRAEPFDPAALNDAMDAMFDSDTSGRTIVRQTLISLLSQFTPEERAAFATNFAERLSGRDEHRGG